MKGITFGVINIVSSFQIPNLLAALGLMVRLLLTLRIIKRNIWIYRKKKDCSPNSVFISQIQPMLSDHAYFVWLDLDVQSIQGKKTQKPIV